MGCLKLSDHPKYVPRPILNKAVLVLCKAMRNINSSDVESEAASDFLNAQATILEHCILKCIRIFQLPKTVKTEISKVANYPIVTFMNRDLNHRI